MATFVVSSFVSYYTLKAFVIKENTQQLEYSIALMQMQDLHVDDLDHIAANIHESVTYRVTFIAEDGIVLADSNSDKHMMQNHSDRAEIIQASPEGFGVQTRYSVTTHIDYLYVAKKIVVDTETLYLRLATPLNTIMSSFYTLWIRLIIIFIIFAIKEA